MTLVYRAGQFHEGDNGRGGLLPFLEDALKLVGGNLAVGDVLSGFGGVFTELPDTFRMAGPRSAAVASGRMGTNTPPR